MRTGALLKMRASIRHIRPRRTAFAAAIAVTAIAVPVAVAGAPTQVSTAHNSKLGTILANSHGYALYMFTKDHGTGSCSGSCAKAWPPLLGGAVIAKNGANSKLLKLTRNSSGGEQATYNGHPLYTFAGDKVGKTDGEGLNQFGGKWYAVNTSGNEVPPKKGSCNPVCTGY
jgi:predicted lipoprotein with Yx(FWY)xxD motif